MAPQIGIRLSIEPLLAALVNNDIEPEQMDKRFNAAIRKAKFQGYVTLAVADEMACTVLSMHPFFVWGQEYEDKVWHDMDDEPSAGAKVIQFPARKAFTAMEAIAA